MRRAGLGIPGDLAITLYFGTDPRILNDDSDWDLHPNGQFTIEPQLASTTDPALPQVTFHYAVDPEAGRILDGPDTILAEFGLTH